MGEVLKSLFTLLFILLAVPAFASGGGGHEIHDLTGSVLGILALIIFVGAYSLVIMEEQLHMRKSKPVMLAAGVIWVLVAFAYKHIDPSGPHEAIKHNLIEYAELFLFLLAAMTYINAMEERNVFQALRSWLVSRGFSLRVIFWLTGLLAFLISPIADNLTTALLMGAVVMAVGGSNQRFVVMACINVVVGANAGGAFSPFGDITTLMVWQKGMVDFGEFFALFLPSLVNWLVPALIMNFMISKETPQALDEMVSMKFGAKRVMVLFLCTIVTAVSFHNFLHLPPAAGMMLGLGYLGMFSYYIKRKEHAALMADGPMDMTSEESHHGFDLFRKIARAEWDTLLFFYGVILCVGGLGQFGYLAMASQAMYTGLGPFQANVLVGILSAIVDNIPVMFAVLTMEPHMSHGHWLLVTLTAGVGGSLLSIGSAAGVALMGTARGIYTFGRHLVFTPAIALGYAASIALHMWINASHFH
ncbi:sodium:proton antiporter NhaD [Desulfuromonas acetoxidans]|uniref:Citrate transporter n=1 Tax=Desulfuromonas acetoxidans (strain DSM 684 / 11070) TaxID=281689 RepID=Q1JW06_DESA6|nr:Citrate transporter [Desulfuromonas acetoxidans DSM 684]MBF0646831.1 sodium:proton antiporter NhaD [Desulfuromonas acetoxidans]NVD24931.1 sodium:proton antiporter NhaD [Desulfuromonas acetoxidans]NVE15232.1 sodium:proton antiporter NhaD [Desulfuromonas acetoxidans]